ncbi:SDR family oxidoreductase [Streptomyces misionensis]|uniref:SDR family oxidoreductase n=1 Tax=Streptomyces misionensis TaxID=67331 RepID=UPI00381DB378
MSTPHTLAHPLAGQRVVVMGGSSGIGEATAAFCAADGAEVIITGRGQDRLDASDRAALDAFFAGSGTVDHLIVALSGGKGAGPFAELDLADLAAGFDGKFWPQVQVLQAALPALRRDGSVTLVTAASARAAIPGTAGLAAINGALEALIPPLAVELAPLRINAVAPGIVDTPWWDDKPAEQRQAIFEDIAAATPVGRVGHPEDIARALHMLAANGFVTGIVLEASGGASLSTKR